MITKVRTIKVNYYEKEDIKTHISSVNTYWNRWLLKNLTDEDYDKLFKKPIHESRIKPVLKKLYDKKMRELKWKKELEEIERRNRKVDTEADELKDHILKIANSDNDKFGMCFEVWDSEKSVFRYLLYNWITCNYNSCYAYIIFDIYTNDLFTTKSKHDHSLIITKNDLDKFTEWKHIPSIYDYDEFNYSIVRSLRRAGYVTIESLKYVDLLSIKGIGPKSAEKINKILKLNK